VQRYYLYYLEFDLERNRKILGEQYLTNDPKERWIEIHFEPKFLYDYYLKR
jgi:hypothetical protein